MGIVSQIGRELAGLFIDDVRIALATLALLALAGVARHSYHVSSTVAMAILCGGLVVVLLENILHSARTLARER